MALPQEADWPPWLRDAKSRPYLNEGAELLRGFLPESLKLKSAEHGSGAGRSGGRGKARDGRPGDPVRPRPGKARDAAAYRGQNQRELDRLIGTQR